MAVDLIDYVPSLKREVQPPGSTIFASVTDAEWVGHLADAFWEARLDGLLEGYVVADYDPADPTYSVIESTNGGKDVDGRGMAVVILYAGIRVLRNRILNMQTGFRAKAGPVEYEQNGAAATVLAEMLKQLRATKDRILEELDSGAGHATSVLVLDAYSTRVFEPLSYYGGAELSG